MISSDIERLSGIWRSFELMPPEVGTPNHGEPRGETKPRVSAEARKLFADLEADPAERIRIRIRSGFYNRPEILNSIVETLAPDALRSTPSV